MTRIDLHHREIKCAGPLAPFFWCSMRIRVGFLRANKALPLKARSTCTVARSLKPTKVVHWARGITLAGPVSGLLLPDPLIRCGEHGVLTGWASRSQPWPRSGSSSGSPPLGCARKPARGRPIQESCPFQKSVPKVLFGNWTKQRSMQV